jgi:hypothetical protein
MFNRIRLCTYAQRLHRHLKSNRRWVAVKEFRQKNECIFRFSNSIFDAIFGLFT